MKKFINKILLLFFLLFISNLLGVIVYAERHTHNDVTFDTAWLATDSLPTESGNYYLTNDVSITDTWNVPRSGITNLDLNGHNITMTGNKTVIKVYYTTLNLYDCKEKGKITGGVATYMTNRVSPGGVKVDSSSTFNMYGGIITGNQALGYFGGGVAIVDDATFNMYGGSIFGNTAQSGGGVSNDGLFNMYGGLISENTAQGSGGGVYNYGTVFNMYGGSISKNTAQSGGGVDCSGAAFNMYDGLISENIAKNGGGVSKYFEKTFDMFGGTIKNNTAIDSGGGIYIIHWGFSVVNTTERCYIIGNSAKIGGGIYNSASLGFGGGTVKDNIATSYGGGIVVDGGVINLERNCQIYENTATDGGNNLLLMKDFGLNDPRDYLVFIPGKLTNKIPIGVSVLFRNQDTGKFWIPDKDETYSSDNGVSGIGGYYITTNLTNGITDVPIDKFVSEDPTRGLLKHSNGKLYLKKGSKVTITFNSNDENNTNMAANTENNGKLLNIPTLTKDKYAFDGWYTEKEGGIKITTDHIFSENTTVYAHWNLVYTIPTLKGTQNRVINYIEGHAIEEGSEKDFSIETNSSGAKTYRYKKSGESDEQYKVGLPINCGEYTIEVTVAKDDVNMYYEHSATFNITISDNIEPTGTINVVGDLVSRENLKFTITSNDGTEGTQSGVKEVYYYISDTEITDKTIITSWNLYQNESEVVLEEEGIYYIYAKILDNAGNIAYFETNKYIIDKTAPIGKIIYNEDKWWENLLNHISFGLLFNNEHIIEITANDNLSGVNKIEYYIEKSGNTTALTNEELAKVVWEEYNNSSEIKLSDNSKYVVYAKITDNVGNIKYISSDGMEKETTNPTINGIENGKIYCQDTKINVTDNREVANIIVNDEEKNKSDEITLTGSEEGTNYTIVATDKAGNSTTITVTVKNKHTYTNYERIKEPTCTENGEETAKCENCEEKEIREIEKLGHNFDTEYTVDKEPTCTEKGSKSQHCLRCEEKQNIKEIEKLEHIAGEPVQENKIAALRSKNFSQ